MALRSDDPGEASLTQGPEPSPPARDQGTISELRRIISWMEVVLGALNDGIVVIEGAEMTIQYANAAFCDMVGQQRIFLLGSPLLKQLPLLRLEMLPEEVVARSPTGGLPRASQSVEFNMRRKDGRQSPMEISLSFLDSPEGRFYTAIVRDISARKAAELAEEELRKSRLQQSEKMASVGQLAAGVAHEINNPLGIILGFAQSAIKRVQDSDPLFFPLKSIEREALRCKTLVQNLLAFSRQGTAAMGQFDLNQLVAGTLNIIEAQARLRSIEVVKELGSLPPVWGDNNQWQQVVINLCNNALDAMPKGGHLRIRTRQGGSKGPDQAVLEIEDTGSGIPKEILGNIFNPFFTTKEAGKGTGLGLSLVHEIVERHHGTIEVRSEVGQGTTFTVFLPITIPQTSPIRKEPTVR